MQRLPVLIAAIATTFAGAEMRAITASSPVRPTALQEPDGKAIYSKNCKQCHGVLGEPTKTAKAKYDKIPSFQDPEFFKKHSHEEMLEAISKGKGEMKGFAEKLSKEEMQAVVQYIHTLEKQG